MRANHYCGSEGGRWGGRFWPHGINRDIYQPERSVARSRGRQGHGTLQSAGQPSRRCSCSCRRPQRRGAAEERRAAGQARHRTVPARRALTGDRRRRKDPPHGGRGGATAREAGLVIFDPQSWVQPTAREAGLAILGAAYGPRSRAGNPGCSLRPEKQGW
jgi:hypothetical protein